MDLIGYDIATSQSCPGGHTANHMALSTTPNVSRGEWVAARHLPAPLVKCTSSTSAHSAFGIEAGASKETWNTTLQRGNLIGLLV